MPDPITIANLAAVATPLPDDKFPLQRSSGTPGNYHIEYQDLVQGGGGSLALTTEINNPLTSLTGITTGSGTWSVSGGQVRVVGTTNTQCSAFLATPISSIGFCSLEVEVEIPVTFNNGSQIALRLTRGGIGNNNGALNINLGSTAGSGTINKANIDNQGVSNLASKAYTIPAAGTWVKLTIKKIGDSYCFYINNVKYFETIGYWALGITDDFYIGFCVYNAVTARFRNLVVKTLSI